MQENLLSSTQKSKFTNNDTIEILSKLFSYATLSIQSLYNSIVSIHIYKNYFKFFFLALFSLLSFGCALKEIEITNKIIYSAYYNPNSNQGKKVNKIIYDEIASSNRSYIEFPIQDTVDIISSYYNEISKKKETLAEKSRFQEKLNRINEGLISKKYTSSAMVRNLYKLYGNKTIFEVTLDDMQKMVNSSLLSEEQGIYFWEELLGEKTERFRLLINEKYLSIEKEYYLLKIFPIKSCFFAGISFLSIYLLVLKTYASAWKTSIHLLGFAIVLSYVVCYFFFRCGFYLSSSLIFFQIIYFIKCIFDTIIISFGYKRDDFEVISQNLGAKDLSQFILKFIILFLLTTFSGIFCFLIFPYALNYVFFYVIMFTFVVFISNCVESKTPEFLSPLKNLIIFSLGLLNFLLSKFHKTITRFNFKDYYRHHYIQSFNAGYKTATYRHSSDGNIQEYKLIPIYENSLYLISDLFTIFCFHYLSDFFSKKLLDKQNQSTLSGNITANSFNNSKTNINFMATIPSKTTFTLDDSLWLLGFIVSVGIGVIGLYKHEYMCYVLSMYLTKIIIDNFSKVFSLRITRCTISVILLTYIVLNHIITSSPDEYISNLFTNNDVNDNNVIKYTCKIISLIQILFFILVNFDFIYSTNDDKDFSSTGGGNPKLIRKLEVLKTNTSFRGLQIQFIRPTENTSLTIAKSIIYINSDFYFNYINVCVICYIMRSGEKNIPCLFLYLILLCLFFVRIFCIITTEFRNDVEYLYAFCSALLFSLRLLSINKKGYFLYYLCHTNISFLVLLYCLIDRRRNIVTGLLMVCLYCACFIIKSNFLFLDLVSLTCLPIVFHFMHGNSSSGSNLSGNISLNATNSLGESGSDNNNASSCTFLVPALICLGFQLYGFKNILQWMSSLNQVISRALFGFDLMNLFFIFQEGEVNEISFIEWVIENLKNVRRVS